MLPAGNNERLFNKALSSSRLCSSKTASIRRVSWHAFFQISTIGWGMISVRVTGGACHENDIFCVTAFPHWLCDLRQPRCSACSRGAKCSLRRFTRRPVCRPAFRHHCMEHERSLQKTRNVRKQYEQHKQACISTIRCH